MTELQRKVLDILFFITFVTMLIQGVAIRQMKSELRHYKAHAEVLERECNFNNKEGR